MVAQRLRDGGPGMNVRPGEGETREQRHSGAGRGWDGAA